MKNNIIIGAALFIISLSNSAAQESPAVKESVAKSFEKSFNGAVNPRWTTCAKNTSLVQFRYMDKAWLAYFDHSGKLITSGRKVSIHELPVIVQSGMLKQKASSERKYGAVTLGGIYEMLTDGVTEYYVPLANNTIQLMIAVRTDGSVVIKSRKKGLHDARSTKDVIARKN
ncbi:MAG TPA: hypothetical protein VGD65_05655 [Chryseosolibacter sp.]